MSKLKIRCLGGFEVWLGAQEVDGFESQKVRALFAYLLCNRSRAASRDFLAGLLWPEKSQDSARRNLRQALYNLRQALERHPGLGEVVLVDAGTIRLNPDCELWLDALDFEEQVRQGWHGGTRFEVGPLAAAAQLYSGDFLAGFHLKDSLPFEEWLIEERERLREAAVTVLRALLTHHLDAGAFALGIQYARQLLRIDPLSEDTHRKLMRLYAYSGRRSRALEQYQKLKELLEQELGLEPMEETVQEYETIRLKRVPDLDLSREDEKQMGPMIPLVGREGDLEELRDLWAQVRKNDGRLTLVEGEEGIGKSRLVKWLLHEASVESPCTILLGRYYQNAPILPYGGFSEALHHALTREVEVLDRVVEGLNLERLGEVSRLAPVLRTLIPELEDPGQVVGAEGKARLVEAVVGLLSVLYRQREDGRGAEPVVLFLDDLQWADQASLELLAALVPRLQGTAIWILGAMRPLDEVPEENGGAALLRCLATAAPPLRPRRLGLEHLEEMASRLVPPSQSPRLAGFLKSHSAGLPLAVAELVNYLWDEQILRCDAKGQWYLPNLWKEANPPRPLSLEEVVWARVQELPPSARRLITLAAVAGPLFDAELLQHAEGEQEVVVTAGLQSLVDAWLIRLFLGYWADSRRDRDVSLRVSGMAQGFFEFTHNFIRSTIYGRLDGQRRRVLHHQVAVALSQRHADPPEPEALAFHFYLAGDWENAFLYLERAATRARDLMAEDTARRYDELSSLALDHLTEAGDPRQRQCRMSARGTRSSPGSS